MLFNKNIEILYGLSYCINREEGNLKLYNTKEDNEIINIFYNIYDNSITPQIKEKVKSIGNYGKLALYALENEKIDFIDYSLFNDYFAELDKIKDKIINDVKNKNGVSKIDFDKVRKFYGFNLSDRVMIYLSIFISGAFGNYANDCSNIVLGIKYNREKDQYGVCGTAVCKIYHEFSHPYINRIVNIYDLKLNNIDNVLCAGYDGDRTEETLVRAMEIIFSYDIFGSDYLKWAIDEQNKVGFVNVSKFVDLFMKNKYSNIDDFIESLVFNNMLIKDNKLYNLKLL